MAEQKQQPRKIMGGRGPMGGGPMGGMMGGGQKPKNFKKTFSTLIKYLSIYWKQFIAVIILATGSSVLSIQGPKILGRATTIISDGFRAKFTGGSEVSIDFEGVKDILIFLILLYVISAACSYIQGFIVTGIAQKVAYNMRRSISEKISRLPLKYFDTKTHGEVLSRITNDVDTVSNTLSQSLSQIITSAATLIGVLWMMFSINVVMTLISICILPLSLLFIMVVVKKSQKYFKNQQEYLGKVNGHIEEMYGGHIIVKAFNGEEKNIEVFDELNDSLYSSAWKSQFLSGLMMPMMNFIGNLGYVVVIIVGAWFAMKDAITIGNIQAFVQYVRTFTHPITQLAQISNVLQSTTAAAERVFEFLDETEESSESGKILEIDPKHDGEVEFKNVRFGYDADKIIINDFSSGIKSGQRVAIVGPTGAGKTTIVKLLMKFYEINNGEIFVDGVNINDFDRNELRKRFGMVLQDTWLFNGTIMENIRYGNTSATDEEVYKAADSAYADHFIRSLPDGYNMIINEESTNISQGEKQLLTIARAVLSNPKILILDEATSSVDTRTEQLIQKGMDNLMKGKTSFVIAHRLSTIKNSDLILVMNGGDIVEQGTHEQLLEKGEFYAKLYNSQFEEKAV